MMTILCNTYHTYHTYHTCHILIPSLASNQVANSKRLRVYRVPKDVMLEVSICAVQ